MPRREAPPDGGVSYDQRIMRGHDECGPEGALRLAHEIHDLLRRPLVEGTGRLIGEKKARTLHRCAPWPPAAARPGELVGELLDVPTDPDGVEHRDRPPAPFTTTHPEGRGRDPHALHDVQHGGGSKYWKTKPMLSARDPALRGTGSPPRPRPQTVTPPESNPSRAPSTVRSADSPLPGTPRRTTASPGPAEHEIPSGTVTDPSATDGSSPAPSTRPSPPIPDRSVRAARPPPSVPSLPDASRDRRERPPSPRPGIGLPRRTRRPPHDGGPAPWGARRVMGTNDA